jgi:hypothetical protein
MNLEDEVKTAIQAFISMKKDMCERQSGPFDLAPMLHFKYKHLKGYCGVLLIGEGSPMEMAAAAWGKVLGHGVPEFMMFMVEGYATQNPSEYKKGDMERDFKNNPDSKVMEVITIQAIDIKTGLQMTGIVPYKYDDSGLPVFDEPGVNECSGESLNANIPALMGQCREATLRVIGKVA